MTNKLVFFGPPGAGKGTIAALASDKLGIPHISTGDIFRANVKNGTELGKRVEEIMAKGDYVGDDLTNALVKDRLSQDDVKNGYILDGYPRTVAQAEALSAFSSVSIVVNFTIDENVVISRLSGRRICSRCGTGFNLTTSSKPKVEGKCDKCGGDLLVRDDDKPGAVRTRLKVYKESSLPVLEYYRARGVVKDLISSDSPQEVLADLLRLLA